MNQYVIELPSLNWQQSKIRDYMQSYPDSQWQHEFNPAYPDKPYQNRYLRTKLSELFEEIYQQLAALDLKLEYTFFAEIKPRSLLATHKDQGRFAVLNLPIAGDFTVTPVRFHSSLSMSKDSVVYEHYYTCPTILNVQEYHSVYNPTDDTRYILSMSIHKTWIDIQQIIRGVAQSG